MHRIDAGTKLIGLLGYPVEHSFSPVMQNPAFGRAGLNYVYLAFAVAPEDLPAVLDGFKAAGVAGLNVTIPHKEAVLPHLDEISAGAAHAGAVNTIVNENGRLVGYNTDGAGFLRSLEVDGGVTPWGKTFLLLGAGGACRAVAAALATGGAKKLYIANRNYSRAVDLAESINGIRENAATPLRLSVEELARRSPECDVVINATSLGMRPQAGKSPLPDPAAVLKPHHLVCDLVYNPPRTLLLAEAEKIGCSTLPGEGMLLYQGCEAFRLWTGMEPPEDLMRAMLRDRLYPANLFDAV